MGNKINITKTDHSIKYKIIVIFILISIILSIGLLGPTFTGAFIISEQEWENVQEITVDSSAETVQVHIVFEEHKPVNCEDGIYVIGDAQEIPFKTKNEIYENEVCTETDVIFDNIIYGLEEEIENKTISEKPNETEENQTIENKTLPKPNRAAKEPKTTREYIVPKITGAVILKQTITYYIYYGKITEEKTNETQKQELPPVPSKAPSGDFSHSDEPYWAINNTDDDVLELVNVSDDIRALVMAPAGSNGYILSNWTTGNIEDNHTVDNVTYHFEHNESSTDAGEINLSIWWYNGSEYISICDATEKAAESTDNCDLSNDVNTPLEARNISIKYYLESLDISNVKSDLDYVNITIVYNCTDIDDDGYNLSATGCTGTGSDCDDSDASVNPGASEICGNGKDDDCDGDIDSADSDCSPNLEVINISYSPKNYLLYGTNIEINITVNSTGADDAEAFNISLYIDGVEEDRANVSELNSTNTTTATFTWKSDSGLHNLKGFADPDNSIAESDETDNKKITSIAIDWPTFKGDYFRTGKSNEYGPTTNETLWVSASLGAPGGSISWIMSSPIVAKDKVYVGTCDEIDAPGGDPDGGNVFALDRDNGSILWNVSTGNCIKYGSPTLYAGRIYAGDTNGNVTAINATNGNVLWVYNTTSGGEIWSSPLVYNETVYFGDSKGVLWALNATSGEHINNRSMGSDYSFLNSPSIWNDTIYFGSNHSQNNGTVFAFTLNLSTTWYKPVVGGIETSSPMIHSTDIYIGTVENSSNWGQVYKLAASSGNLQWRENLSFQTIDTTAVAHAGKVYFSTYGTSDYLHALDKFTGKPEEAFDPNPGFSHNFRSSPILSITSKRVYVGNDEDNIFYSLNSTEVNKSTIWNYSMPVAKGSTPAILDGVLYFGGGDGKVYAIGQNTSNISSCITLVRDNKIYALGANLTGVQSGKNYCIDFSGHNMTLDCNGYNFSSGGASSSAIYIKESNKITIKNCSIKEYTLGINITDSTNSTIIDNYINISQDNGYGVYVRGATSTKTNISSNRILGSKDVGNTYYGIYINNTPNNQYIINNTIWGQVRPWGFDIKAIVTNSNHSLIKNNEIYNITDGYGIIVTNGHNNSIFNNTIYNVTYSDGGMTDGTGIYLELNASNNLIKENNLTDCHNAIVAYTDSHDNNFTKNRVLRSAQYGISMLANPGPTLTPENNTIWNN
ncbi:PQQ-binding-like beta-propeller repeat protein, partial [Candidatus Woesearchaeota archaeon]|nr:PQQ-binding-like beta-propeller repeat protein [Candidatus Woesearchaeota archaeon]